MDDDSGEADDGQGEILIVKEHTKVLKYSNAKRQRIPRQDGVGRLHDQIIHHLIHCIESFTNNNR